MRIRKRQVPFPLLPVTNSDPNLINRSPVMVQLHDATTTSNNQSCTHGPLTAPSPLSDRPQPSDELLPPIKKLINGSDESLVEDGKHHKKQDSLVEEDVGKEERRGQKGNDTRKGSLSNLESPPETFSSSSHLKQDENWCMGEKSFPLKKRRGRMESASEDNNNDDDYGAEKKRLKMRPKRMKTKTNKKNSSRLDDNKYGEEEEEEEEKEVARDTKPQVNFGKKRVRGGALMEGSRCSRVNGRGWRCCQQTLVGYSLCEHHLGKGRLRSMTSVRNKSIGTSAPKNNNNMPQSEPLPTESSSVVTNDPLGSEAENNEEKKPLVVTKKRMKLGMVKARSISSLLGQTNTEIVTIAEDHA